MQRGRYDAQLGWNMGTLWRSLLGKLSAQAGQKSWICRARQVRRAQCIAHKVVNRPCVASFVFRRPGQRIGKLIAVQLTIRQSR